MQRRGFALIEMVVVITVVVILASISFQALAAAKHKARAAIAKGQVSSLAMALEEVKNDTGFYPTFLSDLLRQDRPALMPSTWNGPYVTTITQDPWRYPYYYFINPKTVFPPPYPLFRVSGRPQTETFIFDVEPETVNADPPMPLIARVENYGITACTISINGVDVFIPNMFKNSPRPQMLEYTLDTTVLTYTIVARGRSTPGDYLLLTIYQGQPTKDPFTLGSYAADGARGGDQDGRDVEWYSLGYPHFR